MDEPRIGLVNVKLSDIFESNKHAPCGLNCQLQRKSYKPCNSNRETIIQCLFNSSNITCLFFGVCSVS
jgi:hypothetical protein